MIAPDLNAIPAYLTDLPGWMGSRTEVRGGKPTKVPKTARNTNADSTESHDLGIIRYDRCRASV